MNSFLSGMKNVLLWSYARGTWQYDLLCLFIVATIFLAPSRFFGDRDRSPVVQAPVVQANSGRQIASKSVETMREIEKAELQAFLQRINKLELMNSPQEAIAFFLQDQLKRDVTDVKYEPFTTIQGRAGYRVWFK